MVCTGYSDFTLRLTPNGRGGFRVRVESAAAGRGECEVEVLPLESVAEWRHALTTHLDSRSPSAEEALRSKSKKVGALLFDHLLQGTVRDSFMKSWAAEQRSQRGVRMRLVFDLHEHEEAAAELAALPWELLYDSHGRDFLARSDQTAIVRVLDVPRLLPEPPGPPLSILAVGANPEKLAPVDLSRELERLGMSLDGSCETILRIAPDGTFDTVRKLLRERRWHVVHFLGHGGFDPTTGQGALVFESPRGQPHIVPAERLAEELAQAEPELVFLSACESAMFSGNGGHDPWAGVAPALVLKGVPAVVAMQLPISSGAASSFTAAFYRSLARGEGVEKAAAAGRREISQSPQWATPALYLRGPGDRLRNCAVRSSEEEVEAPPPSRPSSVFAAVARPRFPWMVGLVLAVLLVLAPLLDVVTPVRRVLPANWLNPPECPSPPGLSYPMELIRAGAFTMGSDRKGEDPPQAVTIEHPYCMGVFEVTRELWWQIMEPDAEPPDDPDFPVEGVSDEEALEFVRRLNERVGGAPFRLPSEAQWEYAARAGTTTEYSFGDDASLLPRYGNCLSGSETEEDSHDAASRIGSFEPNPWGLYDMHGNVSEWVDDVEHYGGLPRPEDEEIRGIRRGGSHASRPFNCRSAARSYVLTVREQHATGLRLVREPVTVP